MTIERRRHFRRRAVQADRGPTPSAVAAAALIFAALGAAVLYPNSAGVTRIVLGTPLLLVAPGYSVQLALRRNPLAGADAAALTVALSLSVGILLAVAFDLSGIRLTSATVALGLLGTSLLGCSVALWTSLVAPPPKTPGERPPGTAHRSLLPLTIACLGIVVVYGVARSTSLRDYDAQPITQLWMLPMSTSVVVGIGNVADKPHTYLLAIDVDHRSVVRRTVKVGAGHTWALRLPRSSLPSSGQIVAQLFLPKQPKSQYRTAHLTL
jgi:uncharacterized membrane protein